VSPVLPLIGRGAGDKDRKEVAGKVARALRDQQLGIVLPNEKQTVSGFLDQWLELKVKGNVRPLTYTSYEGLVRLHISPEIGRMPLVRLTAEDIQRLVNKKLAAGLSPKRVHHILSVLRVALNVAVKWDKVPRNVARLVDAPTCTRPEICPFTPDEARVFLAASGDDRLGALFTVALALGLRRGEALGLCWSDVDFDQQTLTARKALQRIDGKLQLVPPKSDRVRTVPLPDLAAAALKQHRMTQLQERLQAGSRWVESDFVFTTTIGTPLDGDNVTKRYKRLLRKAGLRDQRFHDLRHCCGSLLIAQGVHARTVMEILGHSQISVTMDFYGHITLDTQQEAMGKLDDLLNTQGI
jgi:integrase